jgi:hypothetical protein
MRDPLKRYRKVAAGLKQHWQGKIPPVLAKYPQQLGRFSCSDEWDAALYHDEVA